MIRTSTAFGLTLILWASFAWAEDAPAPPTDGAYERDVQIARNLTEASRQATVASNLPLTEAQGNAFWPVYLQYRKDVTQQNERLGKLIQQYAAEYETMTDDAAKQLTRTYLDIDQKRLDLKNEYLKKFEKVLPAALVARAMQTEQKLDAMQAFTIARSIPLVPPAVH
jgi:pyruvate formate-lyase activating enzyme-like uncharacterized protein